MDPIIAGHNPETNIVAVSQSGDAAVRIWKREGAEITSREEPLFPFFHLTSDRFLDGFPHKVWIKRLDGTNAYSYLCAFGRVSEMWYGVRYVLDSIGRGEGRPIESYSQTDEILLKPELLAQYLLQSGMTLFKGMSFGDIVRLQIDIETYSSEGRFSNAERSEDRIILVGLSDNSGWEKMLGAPGMAEVDLLREVIALIRERDPDVIEGHNILGFDLPYLLQRCERCGLPFVIGRDGTPPRAIRQRTPWGESEAEPNAYEVVGRHIIDTLHLVQAFDASRRSLDGYGLKAVAKHFGVAAPDRTYIPGDRISWYWDHEPELLMRYALDDVRETRAVSDRLSPASFYLSQMLPFPYGTISRMGSAAKIEGLLLREYVRQRHSVPKPQAGTQTTGGYTEIFYSGVLGPIVHADVESLYPSIMISRGINPPSDSLRVFHLALKYLTTLRFEAKREAREEVRPLERDRLDAIQSSYKILINSFYGYLGYGRALFNDFAKADEVTTTGQDLLRQMIRELELHNATVVEVDTDGLYFVPPDNVRGEQEERTFVERLSGILPAGINLAFAGRYRKMLSYKKKNYALQGYDDRITMRGSSLISRSLERFGRSYIQQCVDGILNGRIGELHALFLEIEGSLREHTLDVRDLARTETVRDSLKTYEREIETGKRNRTAVYEIALQSNRGYRTGDRISYYFTGSEANIKGFENAKEMADWDSNFPDENTAFYLKRLEEFSEKFKPFFREADFRAIFSSEDLFGFDPAGVQLIPPQRVGGSPPDEEEASGERGIWLDTGG